MATTSNTDTINQYVFKIESLKNKLYTVDTKKSGDINTISELIMRDSVFNLYPTAMYAYTDPRGNIHSKSTFVEREPFEIIIGTYLDSAQLKHKFIWADNTTMDIARDKNVNGYYMENFVSEYKYYDNSDVKTYLGTPDSVATQIVSRMGTPPAKIFATTCINSRYWHQGTNTSTTYIKDILRKNALSGSGNSPFLSFFNLKNEFHFRSLSSLYKNFPASPPPLNSPSVTPLKYIIDFTRSDYTTSLNYIQDVSQLNYMGVNNNLDKYAVLFKYYLGNEYKEKDKLIGDYLINKNNKYPLLNMVSFPLKPTMGINLGIYSNKDKLTADAKINSNYINVLMPLRMSVTMYFNPELVSGRLIEIESYNNTEGEINKLLSGEWLIVEAEHRFKNDPNNSKAVFTTLDLAKPDIEIEDIDRVLQRA